MKDRPASPFDRTIDRRRSNAAKWDPQVLSGRFGASDLLPLWVADMDFASPPAVVRALEERAAHGIFGYPASNAPFLEAWRQWTARRHNWELPPGRALFAPGIVTAMSLSVSLFSEAGGGVILQEPVYQPFRKVIEAAGRTPVVNPLLLREGRYEMDFADLEEKASRPEVSLFLLCSPHNPGGRVWTRQELTEVARICRTHGVFVVSDEIHCDLVGPDSPAHTPFSSLSEETAALSLTCQAPSKTFNIAGEKLAALVLGDPKKRRLFQKELERLNLHECGGLALAMGEAAYGDGENWLEELLAYLEENRKLVETYLKEHIPRARPMRPDAGFLCWIDLRELPFPAEELAERFVKIGKIALVEGPWFGAGGEGFFRLNFGCPRSLLEEGLSRLKAALTGDLV